MTQSPQDFDFTRLSLDERTLLAHRLWESVHRTVETVPLSADQIAEIERRVAEADAGRMPSSPWEAVPPPDEPSMNRLLSVLAVAESDIETAVAWYDGQRPKLGDTFLLDLGDVLEHIREHPDMYQAVVGQVRRAVLHGFPYSILYRVLPDAIQVVGVLHSQADPARLAARSKI